MAGRPERPVDPSSGPVQRLAYELRKLREEAGGPPYREMARDSGCGASTLSYAAAGERLPTLPVLLAYVETCGGVAQEWEERWRQAAAEAVEEAAGEAAADETAPPYRGLERFEPADQDLFFGRGELVAHLVAQVRAHRLVAVVGASGSGKSSLLRAGLIPALREARGAGRRPAAIRVLTPGPRPLGRADLLTAREGPGDTMVVVDQFEEVFTLCADPVERAAFLGLLLTAAVPGSGLRVVIAVRADFFGRCAEHPELAEALRAATVVVGPMGPDELREVIVKPAAAAGLVVERALTARIVREVVAEPGGLPLMSHALLETWRRRRGRTLTEEMYDAAGGIHGAIAATAEQVYGGFSPAEALTARRMLLRLVTPGEGAQDTRRPADRAELTGIGGRAEGESADVEPVRVLERLARARLLTLEGDCVDLAHEAVIAGWPRLSGWVQENRERLRVHRRLTEAARTWEELDRDPGAVYRGSRLALALDTFGDQERDGFTPSERAFLAASLAARDADARAAARTTRRLRTLAAALSALLVLAIVAGAMAWHLSRTTDAARQRGVAAQRISLSNQLAAQSGSLLSSDPDLASLLAVQAYHSSPTAQAKDSLYAAAALPLRKRLTGHTGAVNATAFAPDGRTLATGSADGTVRLWSADGQPRGVLRGSTCAVMPDGTYPPQTCAVTAVTFTRDGKHLLEVYDDGTVRSWDLSTRRERVLLNALGYDGDAEAAFSPDGQLLAIGDDGPWVQVWDTTTGALRATLTVPSKPMSLKSVSLKPVRRLAFDADGGRLATGGDGVVGVWDTADGRKLIQVHASSDNALALTPDGRTLAVGGTGGSITLWNTRTAVLQGRLTGGTGDIGALTFGRDGTTLASGGSDRAVRVWDVPARQARLVLNGHQDNVQALAFSPDGRLLVSGAGDDAARLWNTAPEPARAIHGVRGEFLAVDPTHGRIATNDRDDGSVHLRNASGGQDRVFTDDPHHSADAAAFSPDGRLLAVVEEQRVYVHDTATGALLHTLVNSRPFFPALAFSPDSRTLAVSEFRGASLWQMATGREVVASSRLNDPVSLAFAPDGRTLAVGSVTGRVSLWDVAARRVRTTIPPPPPTENSHVLPGTIAYSPDGHTLALVATDGTMSLCDPATGHVRARLVPDDDARITALAFSPDSRTLATTSDDGTLRLWDTVTARVRTTHFAGAARPDGLSRGALTLPGIAFSPDGRTLVTLVDKTLGLWTVTVPPPAQAATAVCQAVDRDLSASERTLYLPVHTTARTCHQSAP